jgi:hypothetical protein
MHFAGDNTGKRGAVRSNSGEPVHPSGPGLGRTNNSSDSRSNAGGLPSTSSPAGPRSAVPQPKTGRVPEGRALGAREARVPSSLDQQQINGDNDRARAGTDSDRYPITARKLSELEADERDHLEQYIRGHWGSDSDHGYRGHLGRGRHCGRFSVRGTDPTHPGQARYLRVNCKCWDCRYCGPRKAKRYKRAIRIAAERLQLNKFLTLTLDRSKLQGRDSVRYLNQTWAEFRVSLKRRFGTAPQYIRVLEFQKNGNPHFHILIDRYIPQRWVSQAWSAVGGGKMVDIRQVDLHRVSRYLSKYLTKELLMSAPKRSRRITTSRGIHLFEKTPRETRWEFLKESIWFLERLLRNHVVATEFDEENVLSGFSIFKNAAA